MHFGDVGLYVDRVYRPSKCSYLQLAICSIRAQNGTLMRSTKSTTSGLPGIIPAIFPIETLDLNVSLPSFFKCVEHARRKSKVGLL